jgi:hypothetical protein
VTEPVIPPMKDEFSARAHELRTLRELFDDQFVRDMLERIAQDFDRLAAYLNDDPADRFLSRPINSIDFGPCLTVRIQNVCNNYVASEWRSWEATPRPIATVADLVHMTEAQLLREPNFGRKSLDAIKRVLAEHGLMLGMEL